MCGRLKISGVAVVKVPGVASVCAGWVHTGDPEGCHILKAPNENLSRWGHILQISFLLLSECLLCMFLSIHNFSVVHRSQKGCPGA